MQSKVKLSKRQIKEDKFTTFMLTSKDQLQDSWQYWLVAAAAVILVIAAAAYWFSSSRSAATASQVSLAGAMLDYGKGEARVAIVAFTDIVDKYSGTPAAEQATFLLGKLNLEQRSYDDARRYFQMYLDKYKDPLNRAAAHAGLAAIAEDQGDFALAAAQYDQAVAIDPTGPLAAPYGGAAIRAHLASGNVAAAEAGLKILRENFPNDNLTAIAERTFAEKSGL
jgi:TolA-binding protein